jgi:hypothetical protein
VLAIICGILIFFFIAMVLYKVKLPTWRVLYFELLMNIKTGLKVNFVRVHLSVPGDNVVSCHAWYTGRENTRVAL